MDKWFGPIGLATVLALTVFIGIVMLANVLAYIAMPTGSAI